MYFEWHEQVQPVCEKVLTFVIRPSHPGRFDRSSPKFSTLLHN